MQALAIAVLVAIPVFQLWKMRQEAAAATIPAPTEGNQ